MMPLTSGSYLRPMPQRAGASGLCSRSCGSRIPTGRLPNALAQDGIAEQLVPKHLAQPCDALGRELSGEGRDRFVDTSVQVAVDVQVAARETVKERARRGGSLALGSARDRLQLSMDHAPGVY